MYTQVWIRYLPVIKILLKKSVAGEQTLGLNKTDFERAGMARKVAFKFHIEFSNGRVDNVIRSSVLAKDLASVLLEDEIVKERFVQNDYHIDMNAKFQLSIKYVPKLSLNNEVGREEPAVSH
jgi:hypothetical protein